MVQASVLPSDSIVSGIGQGVKTGRSAKEVRSDIIRLLSVGRDMSFSDIARVLGCNKGTVSRVAKALETLGSEAAAVDGRVRSGRRKQYGDIYERILEVRREFPGWGGDEIRFYLTTEGGYEDVQVPSAGRIRGFLSEQGTTPVQRTYKADKRSYLVDFTEEHLGRVGMDCCYPFAWGRRGYQLLTCNLRDWHSGAVLTEVFDYTGAEVWSRGIDPLSMAATYVRYVAHVGIPKVLIVDNGMGNAPASGFLPQLARHAIAQGSIVEFEPFGIPWRNAVIERYHRHLQGWWRGLPTKTYDRATAVTKLRQRAIDLNCAWPQRRLGGKPCAALYPITKWPVEEGSDREIGIDPIRTGELPCEGWVRAQREVEGGGVVRLWGNHAFKLQDILSGSYVRVDFRVLPGRKVGDGTVMTGKGEICATFRHNLEVGLSHGDPLVFDVKFHKFAGEGDARAIAQTFDQTAYNAHQAKNTKTKRRGDWEVDSEANAPRIARKLD